jgi:hypothetical protein
MRIADVRAREIARSKGRRSSKAIFRLSINVWCPAGPSKNIRGAISTVVPSQRVPVSPQVLFDSLLSGTNQISATIV